MNVASSAVIEINKWLYILNYHKKFVTFNHLR